ncbi:MAG TPA: PorT family protein [Bacteroides sp.]|mgnify:CR=1 FL=1|nr:PorT family protein [Bacteroides sp.]
MKTRLLITALILALATPLAFTQSMDRGKISFAVLGGINLQNLNGKDAVGDKLVNDLILGYHGGVNTQIHFAPNIYFQPGLLIATKGTNDPVASVTKKYKLSYIELPLNLVYKAILGNGSILIGFGPYLAYGIGGKVITEDGSETIESDLEFKNVVETGDPLTTAYFKPFDFGGNIFAGYELASGLFGQLNTQIGMVKINPEDRRISNDKSSVKNTGFGLSIGYRF